MKETTWQAEGVCQLASGFLAGLSYRPAGEGRIPLRILREQLRLVTLA